MISNEVDSASRSQEAINDRNIRLESAMMVMPYALPLLKEIKNSSSILLHEFDGNRVVVRTALETEDPIINDQLDMWEVVTPNGPMSNIIFASFPSAEGANSSIGFKFKTLREDYSGDHTREDSDLEEVEYVSDVLLEILAKVQERKAKSLDHIAKRPDPEPGRLRRLGDRILQIMGLK